jgi:type II secretory pathway component PulF
MPVFTYEARERGGSSVSGQIEANNRGHAMVLLRERGLAIDRLVDAQEQARGARARWGQGPLYPLWPIRASSLALFFDQLGRLLAAGVTPHEAFSALQERVGGRLRRVAREGATALATGGSISAHLAKYPRFFPRHVVAIMRAGELSGTLGEACQEIVLQFETEARIRRQIVLLKAYLTVMALLCILVPSFPNIISKVHADPAGSGATGMAGIPTDLGQIMELLRPGLAWYGRHVLYDIVPWLVGAWVALKIATVAINLPVATSLRDWLLLYTPVAGGATKKAAVARFTRTFELMQRAAVPLSEAVREAAASTGNVLVARRVAAPASMLDSGGRLVDCLRAAGIFSPSQLSMLMTAEQAGSLEDGLNQLADKARDERDRHLKLSMTGGCVTGFILAAVAVLFAAMLGWAAIYDNIFKVFESDAWQP